MSSRWRRARSAALAALFGLFSAESVVLSACPMHGGEAVNSSATPADPKPQGAHGAHDASQHDAGAALAAASGSGDRSDDAPAHHGTCDCLGACAGVSAIVLSPTRMRDVVLVRYTRESPPASLGVASVAAPPHRLPFAIPPPSAIASS